MECGAETISAVVAGEAELGKMAQLPTFKSTDEVIQNVQTRWKSQLDPIINNVLTNQIFNGRLLTGINLVSGSNTNVITHGLGRVQIGWFLTDSLFSGPDGALRQIYRFKAFNNQNLTLACTGSVTVSMWVF